MWTVHLGNNARSLNWNSANHSSSNTRRRFAKPSSIANLLWNRKHRFMAANGNIDANQSGSLFGPLLKRKRVTGAGRVGFVAVTIWHLFPAGHSNVSLFRNEALVNLSSLLHSVPVSIFSQSSGNIRMIVRGPSERFCEWAKNSNCSTIVASDLHGEI